jgi:hypothetical protein
VPLLAVDLLMLPAYSLILSTGALVLGKVADSMEPSLGEARALLAGAGAAVPFGVLLVCASAFHDLWRASVVRYGRQPFASLGRALRSLWQRRREAFFGHLLRGVLGLGALGLCSASAHALSPRGQTAVIVAAGIVQLGAWFRVALRVSWLAQALRIVDSTDDESAHTQSSDAGAPDSGALGA